MNIIDSSDKEIKEVTEDVAGLKSQADEDVRAIVETGAEMNEEVDSNFSGITGGLTVETAVEH